MLEHSKRFARWDRIRFNWRLPNDDTRIESRRVDQQSIEIVGDLKKCERDRFLARSVVTSLAREREAGKSFALLKPEVIAFRIEKRDETEIDEEQKIFDAIIPCAGGNDRFGCRVAPVFLGDDVVAVGRTADVHLNIAVRVNMAKSIANANLRIEFCLRVRRDRQQQQGENEVPHGLGR